MILASATHTVTLPDALLWVEELSWTYKTVKQERGVTGKIIRLASTQIGGKPITLKATSADLANVPRATVKILQAMVEADASMTLTLADASSLTVLWRHEPVALESNPALGFTGKTRNAGRSRCGCPPSVFRSRAEPSFRVPPSGAIGGSHPCIRLTVLKPVRRIQGSDPPNGNVRPNSYGGTRKDGSALRPFFSLITTPVFPKATILNDCPKSGVHYRHTN